MWHASEYHRHGLLTIGDNVYLGDNVSLLAWEPISIGDYSFTSHHVVLAAGSHRNDDYSNISNNGIVVGKGCWIGVSASVLGGTKIENGCIVGAGAIVKGNFPKFSIIAGVPGKVIKKRHPAKVITCPVEYTVSELE